MLENSFILLVTSVEYPSRSTANAPPAETLYFLATSITQEFKSSISFFKIPQAFSKESLLRELEHTNSANLSV